MNEHSFVTFVLTLIEHLEIPLSLVLGTLLAMLVNRYVPRRVRVRTEALGRRLRLTGHAHLRFLTCEQVCNQLALRPRPVVIWIGRMQIAAVDGLAKIRNFVIQAEDILDWHCILHTELADRNLYESLLASFITQDAGTHGWQVRNDISTTHLAVAEARNFAADSTLHGAVRAFAGDGDPTDLIIQGMMDGPLAFPDVFEEPDPRAKPGVSGYLPNTRIRVSAVYVNFADTFAEVVGKDAALLAECAVKAVASCRWEQGIHVGYAPRDPGGEAGILAALRARLRLAP